MFTGIIEAVGKVAQIRKAGKNRDFLFESRISKSLKVDESVSHNGVCLTVTKKEKSGHWVTAIDETLQKSNLGMLKVGSEVNLERSMVANARFDGHMVQGHIDQVGTCISVDDRNGSWLFTFEYDPSSGNVTVEKGSIAVNGVSLTCFHSMKNSFVVAIIPYTFDHTNFQRLKKGEDVNLEFDIVGKYIRRLIGKT